jgi:hypothetical protein
MRYLREFINIILEFGGIYRLDKKKTSTTEVPLGDEKSQNQGSLVEKSAESEIVPENLNSMKNEEEKFYYALNHEIRREIIRIVGKDEESSFTQFKRTLKISTGTLYHHLDVLSDILTQNETRKYILTDRGKHAYNFLMKNYDSLENNRSEPISLSTVAQKLVYIVPKTLMDKVLEKPLLGWIISSILLVSFSLLIFLARVDSTFIFFLPLPEPEPSTDILLRIGSCVKFVISIAVTSLICEGLSRFLFKENRNTINFFAVYTIGLLPMLIYLVLFNIIYAISPLFATGVMNNIIMIIFQIWTIWLLSYILITFKNLKLERSLIIVFLLYYGASNLVLFAAL